MAGKHPCLAPNLAEGPGHPCTAPAPIGILLAPSKITFVTCRGCPLLSLWRFCADGCSPAAQTYGRPKRKRAEEDAEGAEDEDALLSGQLSAKILKEAAAQREEVDADDAGLGPAAGRHAVRGRCSVVS